MESLGWDLELTMTAKNLNNALSDAGISLSVSYTL